MPANWVVVVKYYVGFAKGKNMSRVSKNPIAIPKGVEVKIAGQVISVKGSKGTLDYSFSPAAVEVIKEDSQVRFSPKALVEGADALAGTARALVKSMIEGVVNGFQRKLVLVGVGYKAQAQGNKLNLSLGFSHPVVFEVPKGITIETPSQTEVIIKGCSKELVGQVAAQIREFRPPEPYKGKGVKYDGEVIALKEGKKK